MTYTHLLNPFLGCKRRFFDESDTVRHRRCVADRTASVQRWPGLFFESFNQRVFGEATGLAVNFVQDNHSKSARHVLRGLHYQIKQPQGKLVRVVAGEVFDVAVDIRRSSPTFGHWAGEILSADNKNSFVVLSGARQGSFSLNFVFYER